MSSLSGAPHLHCGPHLSHQGMFLHRSTVKLVKRSGLASRVLEGPRGRASQMNVGADAATADLLCFLHADTLPPRDLVRQLTMAGQIFAAAGALMSFAAILHVPYKLCSTSSKGCGACGTSAGCAQSAVQCYWTLAVAALCSFVSIYRHIQC